MRNTIVFILCFLSVCLAKAQEQDIETPHITLKWAPAGLILGSFNIQGEYNIGGKSSLTAKIGLPVNATHDFEYEGDDASFEMKAISFLAGYRMYLSKNRLKGIYLEPYFKYVHHTSEGVANSTLGMRSVRMNFTNNYDGAGVGAQLGAQFLIRNKFVIDFYFLGPEINSSGNKFRAVEATNTIPWTSIEAAEAERDVRDFLDEFPFIRKNTDVMVDKNNRSILANFKGALPGFRIGASFGITF